MLGLPVPAHWRQPPTPHPLTTTTTTTPPNSPLCFDAQRSHLKWPAGSEDRSWESTALPILLLLYGDRRAHLERKTDSNIQREGDARMWQALDVSIYTNRAGNWISPLGAAFLKITCDWQFQIFAHLVRRQRIVTAPCEQERRALCHAEQLSDSPAGSHRGGRTSPAMSRLERRRHPPAAHQLVQQVPGEPGGGRALLQKVRGGKRRLARRLLHAESVPVQRERPETPAHVAGGPLGQQLRLPVWCYHLHHQQPRQGFFLCGFQQGDLAGCHRAPRGHWGSAGAAPLRGLRDVPEVQSG